MNRTSFGALVKRHRLALSLSGTVAACAVILPACGPGGDLNGGITSNGGPASMTMIVTSSPATGTVLVGATRQFAILVRDQSSVLLSAYSTAAWSIVGSAGIATITPAGGLSTCLAAGTVTVHAIGPADGNGAILTADGSLQCAAPPVPVATTMTILVTSTPATGTVASGATRQYAIEVRDQFNAVLPAFTTAAWSIVGTAGIASITPAGGLATCSTAGTVTVHATGPIGPTGANLTADASLQCAAPIPVATTMTILVTSAPTTGPIPVGVTRQYAIEVRDQFNAVMTAFTTAAWSVVGTAGIAVITPAGGLATCGAAGTVTVHAVGPVGPTGANLTADATLQCVATNGNAGTVIVLTPSTVTTPVGGTTTTTVTFLDAGGQPTTNGCTVAFTADASAAGPAVATVTSSGLTATVTGRNAGKTILRASCASAVSSITALARVQVTSPPLNVARVVIATRYTYFPASTQPASFHFDATAQDANGTAVPTASISFAIAGGAAASTDQTGTVTVAASTGGAGGPTFRGGAVLTATSGGQSEVAFVTYGDAGTIRGQLTSATGQYVGGTTASATNNTTSGTTLGGGVTNDGYFYIVGLLPGTYTVSVNGAASGQQQTFSNVVVTAGQQAILTVAPFALRAGN